MVAFYADDGVLSARCPEWLQESFTILAGLFERVCLCTNAQKTKVMTCILGRIRVSHAEEVYNDYCLGASTHSTRKHLWVECNICGQQSMQAASLRNHLESACRTGGYYGSVFSAGRGITEGGPFSPCIFNMVVNAVV